MPQHVLNMLDGLLKNGSDEDTKVLGEGVKATLEIVADTQEEVAGAVDDIRKAVLLMKTHIDNKDCHTPKGILVRTKVIAWAVFIMFLISTIVMYIPEGISLLKSLP